MPPLASRVALRVSAILCGLLVVGALGPAAPARAQEADDAQALAKKLSNPISDMASIPFQFNWENGVGPDEGMRNVLNIQPVVPFTLSDDLNLIGRWILPYVSQPAALGGASGFGDIVFSAFVSPKNSGGVIWGAGPVFSLPMTSDSTLGSGQWSAGPTVVAVNISGPWVFGVLANHLWSIGGTSRPRARGRQPDVSRAVHRLATKGGVTYSLQSESVANWEVPEGTETWTVPINLQVEQADQAGAAAVQRDGWRRRVRRRARERPRVEAAHRLHPSPATEEVAAGRSWSARAAVSHLVLDRPGGDV